MNSLSNSIVDTYDLSTSRLLSMGFQTNTSIHLPTLDMILPLNNHFYRDEGVIESRPEFMARAVDTYTDFGIPIEQALECINPSFGNPATSSGGLVICLEKDKPGVKIISKSVLSTDDLFWSTYVQAHEEAHVVDFLEQTDLFRDWLTTRNLGHINFDQIMRKNKYDKEYLASLIGLATLYNSGFSFHNIIEGSRTTNFKIEQELLPLFRTY